LKGLLFFRSTIAGTPSPGSAEERDQRVIITACDGTANKAIDSIVSCAELRAAGRANSGHRRRPAKAG